MNHRPLSRRIFLALAAPGLAVAQIEPAPPVRVWVRIEDERGEPTAARIYVRMADGSFHTPTRALAREIGRSKETFFHAKGRFQIEVPAGDCTFMSMPSRSSGPSTLTRTCGCSFTPAARSNRVQSGIRLSLRH